MKYIQGDITTTDLTIAHGVNCQNKMGSGVAKALYTKWPQVKEQYHIRCDNWSSDYPPLLGSVQQVSIGARNPVYNLFTQQYYGYDGRRYLNYGAIASGFLHLVNNVGLKEIAIPKIGCGLAGGDWNIVSSLIEDIAKDKMIVTVYSL